MAVCATALAAQDDDIRRVLADSETAWNRGDLETFASYYEDSPDTTFMGKQVTHGGVAAILEFSQPPSALFAALYRFYSRRILPAVGGALSGERGAYEYLPESVRKFPSADRLADMMREAGFVEVRFERLTGGIVALHLGTTACAAR